jgi:CRP-like cAMP-binding protein
VEESDIVGELGILLEAARSATVTATTHTIAYAISRQRLREMVEDDADLRGWMLEQVKGRYDDLGSR